MKGIKNTAILALFLAIFITPSGLWVNEAGQIVGGVNTLSTAPKVSPKGGPKPCVPTVLKYGYQTFKANGDLCNNLKK